MANLTAYVGSHNDKRSFTQINVDGAGFESEKNNSARTGKKRYCHMRNKIVHITAAVDCNHNRVHSPARRDQHIDSKDRNPHSQFFLVLFALFLFQAVMIRLQGFSSLEQQGEQTDVEHSHAQRVQLIVTLFIAVAALSAVAPLANAQTPNITISKSGPGTVTEGSDVTFTVKASVAPTADLT